MNPATHFLTGWLVANVGELERRDHAAIAIAGVIPDIDGLGAVAEIATRHSEKPLLWWSNYHHVLAHNLFFGVGYTLIVLAVAKRRWRTAALAFAAFHVHLLGDLLGGRGPDGDSWPIVYLYPFSDAWQLAWEGQWKLNAWPNFLITGIALVLTFYLAWRRGFSPLEIVSRKADKAFVAALRARVPLRDEKEDT